MSSYDDLDMATADLTADLTAERDALLERVSRLSHECGRLEVERDALREVADVEARDDG